jgi:hypothetical protein
MALKYLDFEEIKQLSARYTQALDFGDTDAFTACFAPGAVLTIEDEALQDDEIGQYAKRTASAWAGHYRHTVAVSALIDGDGDQARSLSYGCFTRDFGAPVGTNQVTRSALTVSGVFEDSLVRVDGAWRYQARTFHRDGTPEVLRRVAQPLEIAPVDAGPVSESGLTALDYEAIRQLTTRYGYTLDFSDADGFVNCFTEDGFFEIRTLGDPDFGGDSRAQGSAALREMVGWLAPRVKGHVRHGVMNAVIEGDGQRASVSSYGFFTTDHGAKPRHTEPDSFMIETTGIYRDQVVKQDGYWRFTGRSFRYDGWPDITTSVGKPFAIDMFRFESA